MFSNAEIKKLATETLTFLLGLADQADDGQQAAGMIRTELAVREAKAARAAAEKASRTFQFEGFEVRLVEVDRESRATKARVYAWGFDDSVLRPMAEALPEAKEKGVDKENDRAYARYNREYSKRAVAFAARVVPALVAAGLIERLPVAFGGHFSRYAGCSCPCSQGVVLNQALYRTVNGKRVDVHISPIDK